MEMTQIDVPTHEAVYRVQDTAVGLTGFIALHSTRLGPAAGGLRMRPYADEAEALHDVLRLSEGMTYKNAAAGLGLGGGKAVIIGDPQTAKTPALLRAFGSAIQSLNGQYWTAEDMGMTPADMAEVAQTTTYVAGLPDGAFASGDPSPITARGVFNAIRTTLRHKTGTDTLSGRSVALQGLGSVGFKLAKLLHDAGARLIVTDPDTDRVARAVQSLGAQAVALDAIYAAAADVFAPCAHGGILTEEVIRGLRVKAVVGAANNQLPGDTEGDLLHDAGILYAPDFVANGGGIINVAAEILRIPDPQPWVEARVRSLDDTLDRILEHAAAQGVSPNRVSKQIVLGMLEAP